MDDAQGSDARGRWARRFGRWLAAAALGLVLPCVLASAATAQGLSTIPAGDPAPPVGLMVGAGVLGVALVAGGAALVITGRRQARAREDQEKLEELEKPRDQEAPLDASETSDASASSGAEPAKAPEPAAAAAPEEAERQPRS